MDKDKAGYQYLLSEAEFLRKSYEETAKEIIMLERYSLLITGVIWTWIFSNISSPNFQLKFLVCLPLIIQFLFGIRAWAIYKDMVAKKNYILKIEEMINLPNGLGWANNQHISKLRAATGHIFWIILQIVSIIIAALVIIKY